MLSLIPRRQVLGLKRTASRARGIADSMEGGPAFEMPSRQGGWSGQHEATRDVVPCCCCCGCGCQCMCGTALDSGDVCNAVCHSCRRLLRRWPSMQGGLRSHRPHRLRLQIRATQVTGSLGLPSHAARCGVHQFNQLPQVGAARVLNHAAGGRCHYPFLTCPSSCDPPAVPGAARPHLLERGSGPRCHGRRSCGGSPLAAAAAHGRHPCGTSLLSDVR